MWVVVLAAGVSPSRAGIPEWKRWQYHDVRQALLDKLQPVALSNCTLARVGSAHDGGYLMCANLTNGIQVAYSVRRRPTQWAARSHASTASRFTSTMASLARPVVTAVKFRLPQRVHRRSIRPTDAGVRHVGEPVGAERRHRRRKVVKIDIEGAEWSALLQTPDEVLDGIDQMPMELHGVHEQRMVDVVRKRSARSTWSTCTSTITGARARPIRFPRWPIRCCSSTNVWACSSTALAPKPALIQPAERAGPAGCAHCQLERSSQ